MIARFPAENLPPNQRTRRYKRDEPSENFDVVHRCRPSLSRHDTLIFGNLQRKKRPEPWARPAKPDRAVRPAARPSLQRDNQGENRATIWMRKRRRGRGRKESVVRPEAQPLRQGVFGRVWWSAGVGQGVDLRIDCLPGLHMSDHQTRLDDTSEHACGNACR